MTRCEYIQNKLKEKNIHHYKIIRKKENGLVYKNTLKEKMNHIIESENICVLFETLNGICKFSVSGLDSNDMIDLAFEKSIQNYFNMKINWDNFKGEKILNNYNFKYKDYINWIEKLIKKIQNKTEIKLDTMYQISIFKYTLITENFKLDQYYRTSESVFMESETFQKRSILHNKFIEDDLCELVINEFNKNNITFKNFDFINNEFSIKAEALASLLNKYIEIFYADKIYMNQSFIKKEDINKKILNNKFNLISVPYEDILFDPEGSKTEEKNIISNGVLKNLLSNNENSGYLNIQNSGNSSFSNFSEISHQRLKLLNLNKDFLIDSEVIILDCENVFIDMDTRSFMGTVSYKQNDNIYNSVFNLSIDRIFNNIYSIDDESKWITNVYCQDVIIKKER